MSHEIPVPPITPSAQAARELAYRRWRPDSGGVAAVILAAIAFAIYSSRRQAG